MERFRIKSSLQTRIMFDFPHIEDITAEINSVELIRLDLSVTHDRSCAIAAADLAPLWKTWTNWNLEISEGRKNELLECSRRLLEIFEWRGRNIGDKKRPKAKEQYMDLEKWARASFNLKIKKKYMKDLCGKSLKKYNKYVRVRDKIEKIIQDGSMNMKSLRRLGRTAEIRKDLGRFLCGWENFEEENVWKLMTELTELQAEADFLKEVDLREKTLSTIHGSFNARQPHLMNSFRKFKLNAKRLGYQYNVSRRIFRTRAGHSQISFFAFEEILWSLKNKPMQTLFFDCSTFSFEVNPKRAWQNKDCPTTFNTSTNYKRFHLILAVGLEGVFAWQIVLNKVYSEAIANFLLQCSQRMRSSSVGQPATFILDNATLHKTDLMKSVCRSEKATFVFIAPHSPYMNPIEECFRLVKSKYRNRHLIDE